MGVAGHRFPMAFSNRSGQNPVPWVFCNKKGPFSNYSCQGPGAIRQKSGNRVRRARAGGSAPADEGDPAPPDHLRFARPWPLPAHQRTGFLSAWGAIPVDGKEAGHCRPHQKHSVCVCR